MPFAARPASTTWEQIPLPGSSGGFFWAWYKPPAAPECLVVRLADKISRTGHEYAAVTLRTLLQATDIDPSSVSGCALYGSPFETRSIATLLDQPIPQPPAGADPNLCISVAGLRAPIVADASERSTRGQDDVAHIFDMMDSDWNVSLQLEKQLVLVRKQLSSMLTRLTTLDRDLSPDERMYGDRQAKSDWQETRRWLKDNAAKLLRYIKEHDTGDTSNAGKREWFVRTYQELVLPRRPIENLVPMQREFESHRKRLQILLNNMTSTLAGATQDGERRAQQVLDRLSFSVRSARAKRRGRLEPGKLKRRHLDP
jgi:hypothetical protein